MDRRRFMVATSGTALSSLGNRIPSAVAAAPPKPWFDPSYSVLPTEEQQTKGLVTDARAAQTKPRTVVGMPVTGLPLQLGEFDEQVATLIKDAGIVGVSFAIAVDQQLAVTRGIFARSGMG